jgi:hypothetical protein
MDAESYREKTYHQICGSEEEKKLMMLVTVAQRSYTCIMRRIPDSTRGATDEGTRPYATSRSPCHVVQLYDFVILPHADLRSILLLAVMPILSMNPADNNISGKVFRGLCHCGHLAIT